MKLSADETQPQKTEYTLEEISQIYPTLQDPSRLLELLENPVFTAMRDMQEELGAQFYLEGGTIRDTLIGQQAKDFDFVVSFPITDKNAQYQTKEELIEAFESFFGTKEFPDGEDKGWVIRGKYGTVKLAGEGFGVYKFHPHGSNLEIDISLPRIEYSPQTGLGGAKNIKTHSDPRLTFEQEGKRRDFTMNAIGLKVDFLSPNGVTGTVIDSVGGLTDLNNRLLRAVGDPKKRLSESLDRVVRAIRFAITKEAQIEPTLRAALVEIISGQSEISPGRAFSRKYPNGKKVMVDANVAINITKALNYNPTATLDLIRDLGAFGDLFAPWDHFELPQTIPGSISPSIKHALTNFDPEINNNLRKRHLEISMQAVDAYKKQNPQVSLTEIMFLLSLDLGKCQATLTSQIEGKNIYDKNYVFLSMQYLSEILQQTGFNTLPNESPLRIDKSKINNWLSHWHDALGALSKPEEPLTPDKIIMLKNTFPDLSKDTFFKLLECYLSVSPDGRNAFNNISALKDKLIQLEQKLETAPMDEKTALNGRDLTQCFFARESPQIGSILNSVYKKYYFQTYSSEEPISPIQAKLGIFIELVENTEIRKLWQKKVDLKNLQFLSENGSEEELARRAFNRSLERISFERYIGAPMEAFLEDPVFAEFYYRKYLQEANIGFERKQLEVLPLITRKLVKNPIETLNWLEHEFQNKNSLITNLFPELKKMIGCEQPEKHHQEGDVWVHTKKLFETALKQNIRITPELALAFLLHDAGKPATQEITTDPITKERKITFLGHENISVEILEKYQSLFDKKNSLIDYEKVKTAISAHMDFYQEGKTFGALAVKNNFSEGKDDLLYQLILCDNLSSVHADGVTKDVAIFESVEKWSEKIKMETALYPDFFDEEFLGEEMIKGLLKQNNNNIDFINDLYEAFLNTIEENAPPNILKVLDLYAKQDLRNAEKLAKFYWGGSKLIAEKGLKGKEISEFQKRKAQEIFERGIFAPEED